MKALLISAALISGAAVYAQSPAPAPEQTVPPPETAAPATTAPAGEGVTQQGTVPSGEAVPPSGANEPPMTVPAGTPMPDQTAPFTPQPATTNYPPCSKTVTDRCIQTYERRRGR